MALVKRVIFLPDGTVNVSQPGIDVDDAGIDQMSFDGRFASIGQAIAGNTTIPRRPVNATEPVEKTIALGRSFISSPMFLFGWILSSAPLEMIHPRNTLFGDVNQVGNEGVRNMRVVEARVTTNQVKFRNWVDTSGVTVSVYWKTLV